MKEITIFCPTIGVGGVEKNLYLILNYFAKQKLKINLLTCSFDKKAKFDNRVSFIGPNSQKFCKSYQIVKIFICLFYFFKTDLIKKKTILFSFQSNIFFILLAYFLDLKIIARINASPDYYLKNSIKRLFFSKIYKLADIIIVNSNDLKRKVKKYLKVNSIVIYNPSFNGKKNKLFSQSKNKFHKKDYISLLNVGRLVHQKNQILLIKTMKYLKSHTKLKFKLNIVGNGDLFNFLTSKILENNLRSDIKIIKNVTNPSNYFMTSDYFILSSLYEGLPNVLIEAISYKKIALSSDCPTGPREILLNGKAGYLFKNNDHIQLAKILIKISDNKKNLQKINLAYRSLNRFDEEKNCKKYLSILNKYIYD